MADIIKLSNLPAEIALIGCVLYDNRTYEHLSSLVRTDHFFAPANRLLWERMGALIEDGKTADGITLDAFARDTPDIRDVGGKNYLLELLDAGVPLFEAKDYARQVSDCAVRRRIVEVAKALEYRAFRPADEESVLELLTIARQDIDDIESDGLGGSAAWENADADNKIVDRPKNAADVVVGVKTGIDGLDKKLGPMRPGQLIVLGGRPGMAKTGVARNIAECVSRTGAVVAFAQLEMSREELEVRSASAMARKNGDGQIPYEGIIDGEATDRERAIIAKARALIPRSLWIMSEGNLSVDRLAASLLALRRARGRLDLVVVDYLQIMGITRERGQNDAAAIGAATRALKQLAKKMQVPIIVLSQVNRSVESRDNKRPTLSDLRESGAIEQDADVVIFVYREEYYLKAAEPTNGSGSDWDEWLNEMSMCKGKIELIIAKKRMGRTGTAQLYYEETTDTLVSSKSELYKEDSA